MIHSMETILWRSDAPVAPTLDTLAPALTSSPPLPSSSPTTHRHRGRQHACRPAAIGFVHSVHTRYDDDEIETER